MKETGMNRRFALGLALPGTLCLFFAARPADAGVILNEAVPLDPPQTFSVPCANGGVGEDVLVSGFLHVLITATLDGSGSLHTTTHFQPIGIAGTGLTTGDVYRATGITRDQANGLEMPFETTFVNNFGLIGPGKGNNLLVHEVFHLKVDKDGVVTVLVDSSSSECK
jgi:hypothetical protein